MEKFEVHILGCGSALPTTRHSASSQVVDLRDKLFMIDCGEGTQIQLRKSRVKFSRINHVFISHLHGDHCFGLIGLISTFDLLGRIAPLHIYAPEGLEEAMSVQLSVFCKGMGYRVEFHTIDPKVHKLIYDDRSLSVYTLPLHHRVPCCGFLFAEKATLPHIKRDVTDFYHIPVFEFNRIKAGADWELPDGRIIPNRELTTPSYEPRSFAYCSDTTFRPALTEYLEGVNLLFHEATFGSDCEKRAKETLHSTAAQAATIARDSHARRLVIGHFSARYEDETVLLNEARSIFPNTILAQENLRLTVE